MPQLRTEVSKKVLSGPASHPRHEMLRDVGDLEPMDDQLPAVPESAQRQGEDLDFIIAVGGRETKSIRFK